jgi:sporulation protein YlmC with PRC-barrel domain
MSSYAVPDASGDPAANESHFAGPVSATVHCGTSVEAHDGEVGSVAAIVVDVKTAKVTHLVVTNADIGGSGRLVPLAYATTGDGEQLVLDLDRSDVLRFDRLTVPYDLGEPLLPYARAENIGVWLTPPGGRTFAVHETPPLGSLALRSPVAVRTRDGKVLGIIASWELECSTGRIRSIVVRMGHLLNRHGLTVSGPLIDYIDDDGVHLAAPREQLLGR